MITRHAALVLLALLVMLVATCRSRSHRASGTPTIYLPSTHHQAPAPVPHSTPAPWGILATTGGVCRLSEIP